MRRALYIAGMIVAGLALLVGIIGVTLSSDRVETMLLRRVTAVLSRTMGTQAHVGAVESRFPARFTVRELYLEDQQGDTLLYADELFVQFSPMALVRGEVRFSHVRLRDVLADAHRLPDSTWNYQFVVDSLALNREREQTPMRSMIAVKDVQLDNIRLRYEHFRTHLTHASMDLHCLSADLLDAEISELAMRAKRCDRSAGQCPVPFEVKDMKAHVILTDSMLQVPVLSARLPQSRLDMSGIALRIPFDSAELASPLRIEAQLVPAEVSLFVPKLKNLKRQVAFSGAVSGAVDSIAFDNLAVRYNGQRIIAGNVSVIGLQTQSNPFIHASLTDLHTNAAQMQDLMSQFYGRPVVLPKQVHRLGDVHYRGLAQGRLHDMTLHGAFRTALGSISTDGTFRADSLFEHMTYDASVVGRNFRLGRMFDNSKLTTVTLDVSSKGQIDYGELSGDVNAHVREFTYNNYTYEELELIGELQPKRYEGHCQIDDPHMQMTFDGVVNMREENPEMNFNIRCRHFDTAPLQDSHLSTFASALRTSFALAVDLDGQSQDKMSGYLVLDSLTLATPLDSTMMKQLTLLVSAHGSNSKSVTLRSDYLTAQLDGAFRYADIVPAFQDLAHSYLPAVVEAPKKKWKPVAFDLRAEGSELSHIQSLFSLPVMLSDSPMLHVQAEMSPFYYNPKPFQLSFFAPGMAISGRPLDNIRIEVGSSEEELRMDVSVEADNMQTSLAAQAFRDTLLTHMNFSSFVERPEQTDAPMSARQKQRAMVTEQRAGTYGGDLRLETHFARYADAPLIELHCLPGTLTLRDSVYMLSESRLTYCAADTTLSVEHFLFEGAGQYLYAHGVGSRHTADTLSLDLQRIDASYVVPFLLPQKTIMFNGLLTGGADITSLFRRPQIETHVHIDSMGLNNCIFGDAEVDLHIKDSLAFHADVYKSADSSQLSAIRGRTVVALDGTALFDGTGRWKLDMQADSVPLDFINHWTQKVLHDLDGYATGHVVVGGWKNYTYVLVRALAEDAHLTLPWTGARYTIPADTIVLDTTAIRFPHVRLTDAEGNKILLDGAVRHSQFRDFSLDLHVDTKDALVFDSDEPGQMLRGSVYATGHVDVTGPESDILVAADARTSKNSRFRLSLDKVSSAYESSFVHFVAAGDTFYYAEPADTVYHTIERARPSRCLVKLNLDINPLLLFQLVLGERNGDVIQARGNGALRLTYDTNTSDVSLLGTYDIDQGTLSYTVANVIRKEFTVGEGSKIVFSGDPANPQLDVTAKYRVTASLRDLFGDETEQITSSRSNIPVLTCLHMTGTLSNPILSFSMEFPLSDQNITQQVRQIINTDEMLMRQVIYLLVFGRFFTPDYMSNAQYTTLNSTYSLLSSTVTSQINSWLSKLTNIVTLGVAIRTEGEGAASSQEYEAQFQLQPVDRLVINGNFGYRYNDISNQPFFGDLDVEVLLTDDGQLRLKGYTHTVDKYTLRQASTIQGVGLVWKIDF